MEKIRLLCGLLLKWRTTIISCLSWRHSLRRDPESRSKFVAEKVLAGATAKELSPIRLTALMKLNELLQL